MQLIKQIFHNCFSDATPLKITMNDHIVNRRIKHVIGKSAAESDNAAVTKGKCNDIACFKYLLDDFFHMFRPADGFIYLFHLLPICLG